MTAARFLARLQAKGVSVRAEGDRLRLRPASALTADELEAARALKPALLRLLARAPSPDDPGLARRVAAFRAQFEAWTRAGGSGVPLLALPDAPEPRLGACVSCGAPIPEGRWRCGPCRHAVELVLGLVPTEPA